MEKSIFDLAVDELIQRQQLVRAELVRRFKGKKPFRMEPIPDDERIMNYMSITPEIDTQLRQQFGDDSVNKMHENMRKLIARRRNNG